MSNALTTRGQAEIERLKLEMLTRRLSSADLAGKSGVHVRVIQNLLAGNNRCWPPRRAINIALKRRIFFNPARLPKNRKPTPNDYAKAPQAS